MPATTITTERLLLRPFVEADLAPFFALNTDPQVVEWLGSSPTRAESDAMAARWSSELEGEGWGFWVVEVVGGAPFVGACGLHRSRTPVPCAPAVEVGWRLDPAHWGNGYATEAATASVRHGFEAAGLPEIVSFTAAVNLRSQAVMQRIGLQRDLHADFDHPSQAEGSPLRRHVLYRASRADWPAGGSG